MCAQKWIGAYSSRQEMAHGFKDGSQMKRKEMGGNAMWRSGYSSAIIK